MTLASGFASLTRDGRTRARKARSAVAFVAGLAVLTACGSTVQQRSALPGTVADGGTGALGDGSASATTGTSVVPGQPSGAGSTQPSGAGSTGGVPSGAAGGGTGASSPAQPVQPSGAPGGLRANVPGVTATTIKIGVYTAAGYSQLASAAGYNVALGDQAAMAKAVIGYLNDHGGIAGRTIVPVIHDFNIASAANPDSEYQAACNAWTQDDHVYAVASPISTGTNTLYACLSKAGVPTVGNEVQDASFFERYRDWFYQPTDMNLRRILVNNVDALHAAGFFRGWNTATGNAGPSAVKIGVILADLPSEHAAVDHGLKPALARHGLALADSFAVPVDSSGSAAYSSAVLRFRAEGITHVLFTFLGNPLPFMLNAENQQYYPRYGLHSRSSPAAQLQGNAPARQQHGAMGIGWQPMNDVDSAHDPGVISARQQLCLKLIRDAGQDTNVRATALVGLWLCDNLFFLRDALLRAPSLAPAGLRAGAESLRVFEVASTFRSRFAPGRLHDGASAYRLFAYKDDCSCYQYVSPIRPVS